MRFVLLFILAAALSACARPERVRAVAREALPIAVELEASAPRLQKRMQLQLRGFAERNADVARQAALDMEAVTLQQREWTLRGDGDRLRRLGLLRERDAGIVADPLAPLGEIPVAPVASAAVPTSDLKSAVIALDRLTGKDRMNVADLIALARNVGDELDKIQAEAAAKEPAQ